MTTPRERVALGATLLDVKRPGWEREIEHPEDLDLSNARLCVLGVLYGSYSTGRRALIGAWGEQPTATFDYGFYVPVVVGKLDVYFHEVRGLERHWRRAIEERMAA